MKTSKIKNNVKLKSGVALKKIDSLQERRNKKNSVPRNIIAQSKTPKKRYIA